MRWLLRFAAACGIVALCLLGAEMVSFVVLQGFDAWPSRKELQSTLGRPAAESRGGIQVEDSDRPMLREYVLHPYLGFVRNYERSQHMLNREAVGLPVNELGFLGDAPPLDPSPQRVVVGITGGSAAEELFLFAREVLAQALAAQPFYAGRDVQIVSIALAGMKQPQQLTALAWLLALGHHFDLVINFDGFNEVALPLGENAPMGVFPGYPRNWRRYATRALDDQALWYAGRLELNAREIEDWRAAFSRAPFRHSSLALLLWHQLLTSSERERAELDLGLRRQLELGAALDAQTRGPPSSSDAPEWVVRRSVALWKQASLQLARLCRANGIAYWQFLQPNLYFPDTKPLSEWEAGLVAQAERYRYGTGAVLGYPLLLVAGRDLRADGVRFVDLSNAFQQVSERVYRDECCHYYEDGYHQLARRIAGAIAGDDGSS